MPLSHAVAERIDRRGENGEEKVEGGSKPGDVEEFDTDGDGLLLSEAPFPYKLDSWTMEHVLELTDVEGGFLVVQGFNKNAALIPIQSRQPPRRVPLRPVGLHDQAEPRPEHEQDRHFGV